MVYLLKMHGGSFHGYVSHNQRVYIYMVMVIYIWLSPKNSMVIHIHLMVINMYIDGIYYIYILSHISSIYHICLMIIYTIHQRFSCLSPQLVTIDFADQLSASKKGGGPRIRPKILSTNGVSNFLVIQILTYFLAPFLVNFINIFSTINIIWFFFLWNTHRSSWSSRRNFRNNSWDSESPTKRLDSEFMKVDIINNCTSTIWSNMVI